MHLLADENFPALAIKALRKQGFDVAWGREDAPGSKDADILARAQAEDSQTAFRTQPPHITTSAFHPFHFTPSHFT